MSDQSKSAYQGIARLLADVRQVRSQTDLGYVTALVATTGFWIPQNERTSVLQGLEHVRSLAQTSQLNGKRELVESINRRISSIHQMPKEHPAVLKSMDPAPAQDEPSRLARGGYRGRGQEEDEPSRAGAQG